MQGNIGQLSTNGGRYEGIEQPQAGIFLRFDWPLYQGGAEENRLRVARSKRDEAEDALRKADTEALREVALAYDSVQTSLAQYDAAIAFREAAQIAFDAATSAYRHGVGTLTDAANAETALAMARAGAVQAHAQALIDAAALAFATGRLTSAASPAITDPHP